MNRHESCTFPLERGEGSKKGKRGERINKIEVLGGE